MKTGKIVKSIHTPEEEQAQMDLINTYTRRSLTSEEVYVFSVVLCDNEIDRDFERFDTEALHKLAELFVGKTGVFDHDPKAANQAARIFSCKVEQVPSKRTKAGDDYYRLTARAYLPRCEKNNDFIMSIDSGIHKEVSVGCAVEEVVCSVCHESKRTGNCNHIKGNSYGNAVCHHVLKNPTDAYEWSFVAVPAQVGAGVIKAYKNNGQREELMENIVKKMKSAQELTLTANQSAQVYAYIEQLKEQAQDGVVYRKELTFEVNRLSRIVQPEMSAGIMQDVTKNMTLEQLKAFKAYYQAKAEDCLPLKPQLTAVESQKTSNVNAEYNI